VTGHLPQLQEPARPDCGNGQPSLQSQEIYGLVLHSLALSAQLGAANLLKFQNRWQDKRVELGRGIGGRRNHEKNNTWRVRCVLLGSYADEDADDITRNVEALTRHLHKAIPRDPATPNVWREKYTVGVSTGCQSSSLLPCLPLQPRPALGA